MKLRDRVALLHKDKGIYEEKNQVLKRKNSEQEKINHLFYQGC